jgi:tRNA A-37 threonylcarbamoyl transferase component Bud32
VTIRPVAAGREPANRPRSEAEAIGDTMQRLTEGAFEALMDGGRVIGRDGRGIKVSERADGTMLKLFRRKRFLSTALFVPYARRFVTGAEQIAARGFATVEVIGIYRVPAIKRHVVHYRRLDGRPLRDEVAAPGGETIVGELADLMARLHRSGIYFRAIHFGNVIVLADGAGLGLIDVSEARFVSGELSPVMRARNFKHLLRYPEDVAALTAFGLDHFLQRYLERAGLDARTRRRFLDRLSREAPAFATGSV